MDEYKADVIEIPTQHNLIERFKDGHGIDCHTVDGEVCMIVNDVELWLGFEEASDLAERLSDAVFEAFIQLRNDMEDKNDRS